MEGQFQNIGTKAYALYLNNTKSIGYYRHGEKTPLISTTHGSIETGIKKAV